MESESYVPRREYEDEVRGFIDTAIRSPDWKGNGLEFDRV